VGRKSQENINGDGKSRKSGSFLAPVSAVGPLAVAGENGKLCSQEICLQMHVSWPASWLMLMQNLLRLFWGERNT